ncbi:cytochrome P450 monooxygenase [Nocardia nova SH22a]|uniref:Cytochrome P450 monooxygenase n=1 Tax=Nocardia nova SH22a TaxID=1415166 RepID=W5TKU3_9NOCA|nr:cytochrome P450 [Nocardia nova]AHH19789.1 cytochrome P450 monooxygenase [Nocardia nova SH22a]
MPRSAARAETDIDLFAADFVADPFPALARLRARSAAVYSTKWDFYVLTRYEDVRAAAADWETFTSAEGVALTPEINYAIAGSILSVDPPDHTVLRSVLADQLAPRGLGKIRAQIADYASRIVAEHVARREFDAVVDISRVFPINVVGDLVGLPIEGREKLQPGADATFAGFGPFGDYLIAHMEQMAAYHEWLNTMGDRSKLEPGGWGEAIMDAVDAGKISQLAATRLINGYLTAGMDTTVNAISALLRLFAERPEIWSALKQDRKLAAPIFEEILRFHSPVVGFWRVAKHDATVGDVTIPQGSKVMLHWAAANHDPAKYPNPEVFRTDRNPLDHVAFGYGPHACAGQGLARMEAVTLLEALAEQIDTIELAGDPVPSMNPIVRGLESVPVRVTAA